MHDLPEFKAADLTRHTSDLFDAAIRSPIAITKHRKPKFVLMSMDQYQQLTRGATQQAHMLEEMPEEAKTCHVCARLGTVGGEDLGGGGVGCEHRACRRRHPLTLRGASHLGGKERARP